MSQSPHGSSDTTEYVLWDLSILSYSAVIVDLWEDFEISENRAIGSIRTLRILLSNVVVDKLQYSNVVKQKVKHWELTEYSQGDEQYKFKLIIRLESGTLECRARFATCLKSMAGVSR